MISTSITTARRAALDKAQSAAKRKNAEIDLQIALRKAIAMHLVSR